MKGINYQDIIAKLKMLSEITDEARDIIYDIDKYHEEFSLQGNKSIPLRWIIVKYPSQNYKFHVACEKMGLKTIGDLVNVPSEEFFQKAKIITKLQAKTIMYVKMELQEMGVNWK